MGELAFIQANTLHVSFLVAKVYKHKYSDYINMTYSVHASKVRSYNECFRDRVNSFGEVCEKLMFEGLNPLYVSTL